MNKKGMVYWNAGTIGLVIVAIIAGIFLLSGGASAIFQVGQFVSKVPGWLWAILVIAFVFRMRR